MGLIKSAVKNGFNELFESGSEVAANSLISPVVLLLLVEIPPLAIYSITHEICRYKVEDYPQIITLWCYSMLSLLCCLKCAFNVNTQYFLLTLGRPNVLLRWVFVKNHKMLNV